MSEPLKVGDTNRAGDMEITATHWNGNGTLYVTVAAPWPRTQKTEDAARRLARRAIMYPKKTRSSRLVLSDLDTTNPAAYRIFLTFAVSRLPR